jgi:ADP-ribose pyrophosphatase YjhB (NUDIX family)
VYKDCAVSRSLLKKRTKIKPYGKSYCAGASVLIVHWDKTTGRYRAVLGKDSMGDQKWSDFGGGSKYREKDCSCAAREVAEETHGMFDITAEKLYKTSKVVFRFPSKTKKKTTLHYTTFVVAVDEKSGPAPTSESLDAAFQEAREALPNGVLLQADRAEKGQVAVVDLEQALEGTSDTKLRSFFRQRLRHVLPLIPRLLEKHCVHTIVLGE